MPNTVYNECKKSLSKYLEFKQTGNELFKKSNYKEALISYTKGLIYAPVTCLEDGNENPISILFSNRSAAYFRLNDYEQSVHDIKHAFKNEKPNINKYFKLMNRLAWSYWHLKKFSKCEETLQEIFQRTQKYENAFHQKICALQNLLQKIGNKEILNSKENLASCQTGSENGVIERAPPNVEIFSSAIKGRHLKAATNLKQGDLIIKEKSYCGILNIEFINTHCNHCYKDCRHCGIPCYGCTSALYCNEICKNSAWKKYHWLECSIWPLIGKMDIFSIMALRIVLQAAYDISQETNNCSDENKHVLNFISNQIRSTNHSNGNILVKGENGSCKGGYRKVFSLLTHSSDISEETKSNSIQLARYLGAIVTKCLEKYDTKVRLKKEEGDSVANNLKSCFENLSLKFWTSEKDFEIEEMRKDCEITCKASDVNCLNTKETQYKTPSTFNEILAYLLNHHILQLMTNSQAIFQTLEESCSSHSTNIAQKRIATAVFPTLSLLNHSCDPNTVVNFHGNTVSIKVTCKVKKGDEVLHCYGPCVKRHSYKQRQNMLKSQYYFKCDCSACHSSNTGDSDLEAYHQQFTAYKCSHCGGPCVITDDTWSKNSQITGKCMDINCSKSNDLTKADKELSYLMHEITEVESRRIGSNNAAVCLSTLQKCLGSVENLLYHNHETIGSLHDLIAICYIENEQYKEAIPHIQLSIKITCMRFGSNSIEAAREFFKLTTLQVHVCDYKQAQFYLKKCLPTLRLNLNQQGSEWKEVEEMQKRIECGIKLNLIN